MEPMKKKAYVEKINGDMAVLKVKRECACQNKYSCDVKKCFTFQNETVTIEVKNDIGAKTGDYVEVEGKTSSILTYAAVVFLMPLIAGLAAYFIAAQFMSNEIMPYIISGVSFIASIVFLYYFLNKIVKGREDFIIGKIL